MASQRAVAGILNYLAAAYQRVEITPQRAAAYYDALADLDEGLLKNAARQCVLKCKFFPTPAELRDAAGANVEPMVDTEAIADAIRSMGIYNPARGTVYPTGAAVREVFGEGLARAYIDAGGANIFTDNEPGREIAQRKFRESLKVTLGGPHGHQIADQCAVGLAEASRISARLTAIRYGELPPALPPGDRPFPRLVVGGFKRLLGGGSAK